MLTGHGVLHCKSGKQKVKVTIFTEAELVGVSNYLPYNICAIVFMEGQRYLVEYNMLYQDNQSTMRMEKNGRNSCTGNSRHENIKYFYIKY